MNQDDVYEATIGSGKPYAIKDWLQICFTEIGKNWKEYIDVQNHFIPEYNRLISDPSTIHELGWIPKTDIRTLCKMMMEC
jgi:GDPmannose 4,6-dehydratase